MNKLFNLLSVVYKKLIYSIAFIPTIMVFLSLVLGFIIINFEDSESSAAIKNFFGAVLVQNTNNASTILSSIIAGIISLTVFSFSMVMIVLNRTSASLSPRVLPQLVAQKFHQIVLGFYMGTIVYSLILITKIDSDNILPTIGILLAMIFTICSLALFIYFIHSISQSIQVDNILNDILKRTSGQIDKLSKAGSKPENTVEHHSELLTNYSFVADVSGFYELINTKGLVEFLGNNNICAEICIYNGQFMTRGDTLAKFDKILNEKDKVVFADFFKLINHNYNEDDFHFGLRKISEIAVKALSPGINDQGTALKSVRYLTLLFEKVLLLPKTVLYADKSNTTRLSIHLPKLDVLIADCITPIRQYSDGSMEILTSLFDFFYALLKCDVKNSFNELSENINALISTANNDLKNEQDRKIIAEKINAITKLTTTFPTESISRHQQHTGLQK